MHRILYLLVALTFVQCYVQQGAVDRFDERSFYTSNREASPRGRPGACYAKCMIPDKIIKEHGLYAVYTGEDGENNKNVEFLEIEINPGGSKWVKKKADNNCRSSDPEDCLVWCLVNEPSEYIVLPIVRDTTITDQFKIEQVTTTTIVEKGGETEWREVVCNSNVNAFLSREVQSALFQKGYDPGPIENNMGATSKAALIKFQKENNLPVGQLDFETLDALEVNYQR